MARCFVNQLAGGGIWAICIAIMGHDHAVSLLQNGFQSPIGCGHPAESFTVCGVGAFEHVTNAFIPPGMGLHVYVQFD